VRELLLSYGFFLAGDRALRTLTGARVRLGALAANGQPAPMAHPAIAADIHESLDVALDLAPEVAFDTQLHRIDRVAKLLLVFLGHRFDAQIWIDSGERQELTSRRRTDAVNVRERDLYALFARQIDSSNTSH
jgi:hypothetical protein